MSAPLVVFAPAVFANTVAYPLDGKGLVTAQGFEDTVGFVGYGEETDDLVRHRYGQEQFGDSRPLVDGVVVEIRPMKIEIFVEPSVGSGVGEVESLLGCHSHKDLHQREDAAKDAFAGIFFDLEGGLRDRYAAAFEFDMIDGHAVDKEHQVAAPVVENGVRGGELRLLGYLVARLPGGYLHTVVDFQGYLFAEMECVVGVVAADRDRFSVDKAVQAQRCTQGVYLVDELLLLAFGERAMVELVDTAVVLVKDICPVVEQVLCGGIMEDLLVPPVFLSEDMNERLLKIGFSCERHIRG